MPTNNGNGDINEGQWQHAIGRRRCFGSSGKSKVVRRPFIVHPDGNLPGMGLSHLMSDDSPSDLRAKYVNTRAYFYDSKIGSSFVQRVLNRLRNLFAVDLSLSPLEPDSVDVLCLGLGNPAVDRASLRQLALLDVILDRWNCLNRHRTRLYDPVFRQVARDFISELGMQVIETNQEGCYTLDPDRLHLVILPHCAPALLNNLLFTNWSPHLLSRLVLFSNGWRQVRAELAATGEPERRIQTELACIHALEPALTLGHLYEVSADDELDEETDFEGMRFQCFPVEKLVGLPETIWSHPSTVISERSTSHSKLTVNKDQFYGDLIDRSLIPHFVEDRFPEFGSRD